MRIRPFSLLAAAILIVALVPPAAADHVNEGDVRFKTTCNWDHTAQDDPIVAPGVPGGSPHMHDFLGVRGVTAFTTTFAQLQALPFTTCNDPGDKAAYWVPTVSVNSAKRTPVRMTAYYRLNGKHGPIEPYPDGLKMVAGHNMADMTDPAGVTGWQCNETGLPNPTPAGCRTDLTMRINFPDCWDGVHLDSVDHRSHMAYAIDTGPVHVCPATHPHQLPALTMYVHYGSLPKKAKVTLSSGDVEMGVHADFFDGWDRDRQLYLIEKCLIGLVKCDSGGGD